MHCLESWLKGEKSRNEKEMHTYVLILRQRKGKIREVAVKLVEQRLVI